MLQAAAPSAISKRKYAMAKRDSPVGYGKPPEWSRFKKGQSGNPQGRPKKVQTVATLTKEILDEEALP